MPGRPRKLSESKQGEVCALIHSGCTLAAAARYVGCSPLAIQREAHRNPDFYEKLRMARYALELSPVHTLRDAARDDWRAAAWLFERTQPQHYSKRAANSFSPQEVADLLDRVCDIIRQETRDARKSALHPSNSKPRPINNLRLTPSRGQIQNAKSRSFNDPL